MKSKLAIRDDLPFASIEDRFYTIKEIAHLTGFSEKTIRNAIYRGNLEATNMAQNDDAERAVWRISKAALQAWVRSKRIKKD